MKEMMKEFEKMGEKEDFNNVMDGKCICCVGVLSSSHVRVAFELLVCCFCVGVDPHAF